VENETRSGGGKKAEWHGDSEALAVETWARKENEPGGGKKRGYKVRDGGDKRKK